MGMHKMFSSGSIESGKDIRPEDIVTAPNPSPYRFEIIKSEQTLRYSILMVRYKDCTTYNGLKVLVYECSDHQVFKELRYLDPHFVDNDNNHPYPVARFTGDDKGYYSALVFCKAMDMP